MVTCSLGLQSLFVIIPISFFTVYWVVCASIQDCALLLQCLEELATKYPATKFVKIISTDCIPNYPDRNLPTILVYNNGAVKGTYVGLHHFGSRRCTPEGHMVHLYYIHVFINLTWSYYYFLFLLVAQVKFEVSCSYLQPNLTIMGS